MFGEKIRIQNLSFKKGKRIIVISDIHGNLRYFQMLLKKIRFTENDYLVIDGDFLEKGTDSIEMLRYVMKLKAQGNVYPLLGNCDSWYNALSYGREGDRHLLHYFQFRKSGLLYEMLQAEGICPEECDCFSRYADFLKEKYREEFAFLSSLPYAIETEYYTFVHAGMDSGKSLEKHSVDEVSKRDAFLNEGSGFSKWVITGHWPVMLYSENIVTANPIILRDRKIVCIDGACVLKDDGQLNALIIPENGSDEFTWDYYADFPEGTVLSDQEEGDHAYYIRWGDSKVEVLERGTEFSRCRHIRTGYEMDILTKYLFSNEKITGCNDCSDYVLPLKIGDRVSIIEETSRGYYVKHEGVSGWYFGELLRDEAAEIQLREKTD